MRTNNSWLTSCNNINYKIAEESDAMLNYKFAVHGAIVLAITACTAGPVESTVKPSSSLTPSSETDTPQTPSLIPSPLQTPGPIVPSGEATSTPTAYFIEATPKRVCYGEQVNIKMKIASDQNLSIYLEKQVPRPDKIPPLYNEHILLTQLNLQKDKEATFSVRVMKTMEDTSTKRSMAIGPGDYMIPIVLPSGETDDAGTITVKDCSG